MKSHVFIVLAIAASAHVARADDPVASSEAPRRPPPEPQPVTQPTEPNATTVVGAPRPGGESGRTDPGDPGDSTGRVIARGALFLPRVLLEIALWPGQEALDLNERYQLTEWYYRLFFFNHRQIGIVPTATYATGYGLTVGAQVFDTNTFNDGELSQLVVTTGTAYRIGTLVSVDSGNRLGPVKLQAFGNFDRRPTEPFYGIGNSGTKEPANENHNIDALTNDTAVQTHFRYQEARTGAAADFLAASNIHLGLLGSIAQLKYTHSPESGGLGPSVEEVYDPDTLVGFDTTTTHVYGQGEIRWDSRRRASILDPMPVYGTGSLALAYGGISHQTDGGATFAHYGVEFQHFFHIGDGPRFVIARFHGEAVSGNIDEIPITELPMLGGSDFLRGYDYARFRDRLAQVSSIQYQWALGSFTSMYVFTDVGRVYDSWNDVDLIHDLHAGFGVGLSVYNNSSFFADLALATSSNGGITVAASFSPVLDARSRWR